MKIIFFMFFLQKRPSRLQEMTSSWVRMTTITIKTTTTSLIIDAIALRAMIREWPHPLQQSPFPKTITHAIQTCSMRMTRRRSFRTKTRPIQQQQHLMTDSRMMTSWPTCFLLEWWTGVSETSVLMTNRSKKSNHDQWFAYTLTQVLSKLILYYRILFSCI